MKHMADLKLEGELIKIYPEDSVQKWGKVLQVTKEGIVVKVARVLTPRWSSSDGWKMGDIHFLSWTKLKFKICNSEFV